MPDRFNEEDFVLLTENTYADGALSTIFSPVKDSLKKYGEVLKDSAKLIGGDIGALIGLTFGRLKDLQEQEQFMKGWNNKRKNLLSNISANSSALMESWPDGKITSMMIAPGAFFASEAISGMGKVTSKEFRSNIGEFGFNQVPLLKMVFGNEEMSDNAFWNTLKSNISSDDWEGSGDKLTKKLKSILGVTDKDPKKATLFQKINKIFLWSHHEPGGGVLLEADELSEEDVKEKFAKWFLSAIEKDWPIDRDELLESRQKEFDKIVNGAAKTIELNSMLSSTQSHEEFFKILKEMSKMMGEDSDFDADKVEKEFVDMGKKLKEDEKSMETLKAEFEENKEEATEEKVTQRLVSIVLDQFKSQFLPKMKEELTDYYDDAYDIITGKLEKEQMAVIAKGEYGKKLVDQIKEHKKKLDDALTKLEGS